MQPPLETTQLAERGARGGSIPKEIEMSREYLKECALRQVVHLACLKPNTTFSLGDKAYLFRPTTGQGCYFIWGVDDGQWWWWMNVEELSSFGPFKRRVDAIQQVIKIDEEKHKEAFENYYRQHVSLMRVNGLEPEEMGND